MTKINMPQEAREHSGTSVPVKELPQTFWDHLTPAASKILKTEQGNTIAELFVKGDEWIPIEYGKEGQITECPTDEWERTFRLCRFFSKVAYLDDKGQIPDSILKKTAATMNLLVEDGKINYGVVCPPSTLQLASGEMEVPDLKKSAEEAQQRHADDDNKITEREIVENFPMKKVDMGPPRVAILIYVFSDFETEELNVHLNNEAFAEEGDLGSDNWDNLPG